VRFAYLLFFGLSTSVIAGSVGGPNVVWVNLDPSADAMSNWFATSF